MMIFKKIFVALIFIELLNCNLKAQDFHFIYISLDNSMSYSLVNDKLSQLLNKIEKENEEFVILFTNSYPKTITMNIKDEIKIKSLISNTASTTAIDISDELHLFLDIFEKNEVCQIQRDTLENKLVVRPINKYKSIAFDFFVGNEFFELGTQNNLLAKFLFASDLQLKDFNVDVNYYDSSNLSTDKIKFSEIYRNNNIKTYIK
jgi:hypothetical protein